MDPAVPSPPGRGPRTSRSPRCSSRARCARTCGPSTASRGSWTSSATRPRATGSRCSTSWSARSTRCYDGHAVLAGDAAAPADDPGVRPAARAVPAADRVQPDRPAEARVRDLGRRASGTATTPPTRSGGSCSGCSAGRTTSPSSSRASDDVCTGLQLVNFLQDVPRDLELGRSISRRRTAAASTSPCSTGRTSRCAGCSRFEAERARGLLGGGAAAPGADRRPDRARGRPLRARGARGARRARGRRLGHLHAAAAAVAAAARAGGVPRDERSRQAYAEVERMTRERARNFAYGIMVLPKAKRRAISAIYAFAREVDDTADGDAPPGREARAGWRSSTRRSTRRRATTRCGSRSPTRASASRSPRRRCTTSSTAG